jgi:starch synthase
MRPLRILHVASEVAPYSKTGGLADVLGALPRALSALGHEVVVVTPLYRGVDPEHFALAKRLRTFRVRLGSRQEEVIFYEGHPPGSPKVRVWFVGHRGAFDREGIYGPKGAGDHPDNAWRFALLGSAALSFARELAFKPDVIHGHDWQAGPLLLYAAQTPAPRPRLVFTVHNLAYQGLFPSHVLEPLGLPVEQFHPDGYEYYGQVNLLKAGVASADHITTVSPRYAREIFTPEHGVGLDGFLRTRAAHLSGILNGVDYSIWSPEHDPMLPASYSAENLTGKHICKAELQHELGLPALSDVPLCGSISRLAEQKGFDLMLAVLPALLESEEMQFVLLGSGESVLEKKLQELAARHPRKFVVRIAYDEGLAHRIEAGADLFVMPSRYEPCGLNQLYSLRYGTPPIVRATGGLDDTIVDYEPISRTGTGFKFESYQSSALLRTWRRALTAYRSRPDFEALIRRGMAQDFSWAASARRYDALYHRILDRA